ncbi:MFS transporter [Streptomyces sp. NPDC005435]|uniref:MFS transporter n=1 Tax=Streptomyces sp. NPDC005435 TaxID=3154464 RepID=UPI003454CC88
MITESHARRTGRLLVSAAFVTSLGNNVQLISGALLVIRAEHTMMSVGWLFIAVAVPQAVLSPFFGRLADRVDRRALWILSDLASTVTALALPLWLWLAPGDDAGAPVYLANLALAVLAALFFPVSSALIKERIPPERLRHFNAHYEMATQAGMLLSATVGGLAVQAVGAVPLLLVNAGTFAVSAVCVAAVGRRGQGQERDAFPAAGNGDGTGGRAHARAGDTPLALPGRTGSAPLPMGRLIVLFAQGSVVVTVFNALLPKFVLGDLHLGAGTFGLVDALGSLGFLLATAAYKVSGRRLGDLGTAVTGFLLCSVLFVLQPRFGVVGVMLLVPAGAFVFGQARIASRNLLMAEVGPDRAGRAFGVANGGGLAATIVVMVVAAQLTDRAGIGYGFAVTAVLSAVTTAAAGLGLSRARGGGLTRPASPPRTASG